MVLINSSDTDYIVPSGVVYADYDNDMFFLKKPFENNKNHYMYINIRFSDGKMRSRRLHVLLAKAFLFNPDPKILKVVGHKDNNKQNNDLSNLYWTTNQENSQKAVDDGLNKNKIAEENIFSQFVKVLDKNTLEIVGVYGSCRECARKIENISFVMITKMCKKNKLYKPRSRKYIYMQSSKEEFDLHPSLQNIHLIENPTVDKSPTIFRLTNVTTGQTKLLDNQTTASAITGIQQAIISRILKEHDTGIYNGWIFEYMSKTTYKESSAYENQLQTVDSITVKNINDGRILTFNTSKELKDYFGLNGHDINHYFKTGQIMLSEWELVDKTSKNNLHMREAG